MENKISVWEQITRSYTVWDENNIKGFFGYREGEYRFLSNFFTTDVYFEGLCYPSSENAYMAAKTLDLDLRLKFSSHQDSSLDILKPKDARDLGQTIVFTPNWENIKYDIMLAVVFDKFWRNSNLRDKLLKTGDKYLEESCHWHDLFWAKCYCSKHNGRGENNLGDILMKVRNILRK